MFHESLPNSCSVGAIPAVEAHFHLPTHTSFHKGVIVMLYLLFVALIVQDQRFGRIQVLLAGIAISRVSGSLVETTGRAE